MDAQSSQGRLRQQRQSWRGTRRLVPTKNYLDQHVRSASKAALDQCLADVTAINAHCRAAHWNVRGPDFYQLHELFEHATETLEPFIDGIAERATALGGQAHGTAPVVARQANVPQMPPALPSEQAILEQLASSLATFDATLYEQINAVSEQGDLDTADLLNEVSREVSKVLWFVEAHLQGQGITPGQDQQGVQ